MSAMLTYFCLIVTPKHAFTKGSCSETSGAIVSRSAKRRGAKRAKHYPRLGRRRKTRRVSGWKRENGRRRVALRSNAMASQSYDKIDGVIWYDGKLVKWADANVHILTHGLHYASCVFEGERAYGGRVFKSTAHSERLKNSANILDFEIPYSVAEIDAAKQLVIDKNNLPDAYLRPIAWRGSEMMGVSAQANTIHLAIAAWDWPSYFDPAEKLKGIRIGMAEYRRPDPATIPAMAKASGLYMICTISKHKAERQGYADAMMLDWQGRVAECTGANIFFIQDGKIHTPIAD